MLSYRQRFFKRFFDIALSLAGLICTWWIILFSCIMASRDTGEKGFFIQLRVGMNNKPFNIMKIRTMISAEKILLLSQPIRTRGSRRWDIFGEKPRLMSCLN